MSPRRNPKLAPLLLCLCGLLAAGRAWALKTDKDQPVNIHADHADFKADPNNASNGVAIYTGHVVITQGSIVLNADKAVLRIVNNDLSTADLTGTPATFAQQPDVGEPMHGQSLEITYDAAKNEITLITQAKLTQEVLQHITRDFNKGDAPGERLMTADVIHYNTQNQRVIAKSGDEQQRVHVTFPPKTAAPASSTAPAAATTKGKKALTPPVMGTRAPTVLGAAPQVPDAASMPAPAAATQPGPTP